MTKAVLTILMLAVVAATPACHRRESATIAAPAFAEPVFELTYDSPVSPAWQTILEQIDFRLRQRHGLAEDETSVGFYDFRTGRLALVRPDRLDYAASVAKIGILYAWFHFHPEAVVALEPEIRHQLGLMAKASSNTAAARFSRELGLPEIQRVLNEEGFYDETRGGGLWVGKHYGPGEERYRDPIGNHSHAITVRQVMRFFIRLEQGRLISPEASTLMRDIFLSPEVPHDRIKFVKALEGRDVEIIRKWGSWQQWLHDAAVIKGPNRHYLLVGMTRHLRGDAYLVDLAREVDDRLAEKSAPAADAQKTSGSF